MKVTLLLTRAQVADVVDSLEDRLEHVRLLITEEPPGASKRILRDTKRDLLALLEDIREQADIA